MQSIRLSPLFQRLVLAAAAVPALGSAACGGRADDTANTLDAALDAAPDGTGPEDATADAIGAPDAGADAQGPQCDAGERGGILYYLDGGTMCNTRTPVLCGLPDGADASAGATLPPAVCSNACAGNTFCTVGGSDGDGGVSVNCYGCRLGRRPVGYVDAPADARSSPVGDYFARAAYLEAASIDAFRILEAELALHGAPAHLARAAASAAEDEVVHARAMSSLARRFGAEAKMPPPAPRKGRTLEEIAIENATEGCVRETYSALAAEWQARAAEDPRVAAALRVIAADETRHAELAWEVARWAETKLDGSARARVDAARRAAAVELRRELGESPPAELVRAAGIPRPEQALRLLDGMAGALLA